MSTDDERRSLPVGMPALVGNEKAYVMDCLESTWISATGKYVDRFQRAFAEFCGVRHAMACTNGTVALHVALVALGVGPGDEVLMPTLTFVATANAVTYCGGVPVFVDAEPDTWNMAPALVEAKITPRTKAIIVVHLFGHPVDMDPITAVAKRHGLAVVEDAAEAHGAEYKGRRVGSLGDIATFSFYANKIITTGEGGAVVTDNADLAARVRQLIGHGMDPGRRYWFPVVGYNYRMTNVTAAIGLAQLEKAPWHLDQRIAIARMYEQRLGALPQLQLPVQKPWARNVYWMYCVILGDQVRTARDDVMAALAKRGIETRPFFSPMHVLPPYEPLAAGQRFPVADRLASRGITLPTWAGLQPDDVEFICEALSAATGPA